MSTKYRFQLQVCVLLGHAMEAILTIRLHKILMNSFLWCSSFVDWYFHFKEKYVIRKVLECTGWF